jgi:hypothetical protein
MPVLSRGRVYQNVYVCEAATAATASATAATSPRGRVYKYVYVCITCTSMFMYVL